MLFRSVRTLDQSRTVLVANTATVPTGAMVLHPSRRYPTDELATRLDGSTRSHIRVDATGLTMKLLGDDSTVNVFVAGVAVQSGFIPVDPALVERAIELNGVAVAKNVAAFRWGRAWVADAAAVEQLAHPDQADAAADQPLIVRLAADLKGYQSARYSQRFLRVVEQVMTAEQPALTEAVARNLHKLMAYKDEYEVARLHSDPAFREQISSQFDGDYKLAFHLAPPLLARKDKQGRLVKQEFGPWMMKAFGVLAKLKGLRGGVLDVFGYTRERRAERQLIRDYEILIEEIAGSLTGANHATAVALASIPEKIRGFGHVKERSITAAKAEEAALMEQFRVGGTPLKMAAE